MKIITYIYSSQSVEALQNLINEFRTLFNYDKIPQLDDMFYYGVFCKATTYSNYKKWDAAPLDLDIPEILTSTCSSPLERADYINSIIQDIMKGSIGKPEWMKYIEEEEVCDSFDSAPSTFLVLLPKENKYKELADKLIEFLYSPNMMISEIK